jgi:hypothetical protein
LEKAEAPPSLGRFFVRLLRLSALVVLVFNAAVHAASRVMSSSPRSRGWATGSTSNEWIELYNNTASSISLTNWTLKAADNTPSVTLSGSIGAYGYYLLERTDDNSVPGVTADKIYTGAMVDSGEQLVVTRCGQHRHRHRRPGRRVVRRHDHESRDDEPDGRERVRHVVDELAHRHRRVLRRPRHAARGETSPAVHPTTGTRSTSPIISTP